MIEICDRWGNQSPYTEAEDVLFSRHISKICGVAPLEVAQAFACETTYNQNAIGSHAVWKFMSSNQLADHLDKYLRATWSMVLARGEGEKKRTKTHLMLISMKNENKITCQQYYAKMGNNKTIISVIRS